MDITGELCQFMRQHRMGDGMSEKLFEIAQKKSGCFYMSDMFRNFDREDAVRIFSDERVEDYSLKEWNGVLDYILKEGCYRRKSSLEEIARYLKKD